MVKISVILPIYNVEDYLEETLDCLLNQTIADDIEVLMIDDGSTDNSKYIIQKYALDYENFHAFHKKNEGQGIARNFGLKYAKGEYIHFLDSDDYIPHNAYETLYDSAIKNDSDIVIGDVLRFGNYNIWSDSLFKHSFEGITQDIESTTLKELPSLLWDTSTSNKLYKKDFILENNIEFPNRKIFFEDLIFSMESYIKAGSIYISKFVFYYWRFRGKKTSVTQQHTDIQNFYDRIEILRLINQLMMENNLDEELVNFEYMKWLNHDLKIFLKKLANYPKDSIQGLVNSVNDVLKIIPDRFIFKLNSFKRILYCMVKNNDIDGLLSFGHLEKEFMYGEYDFNALDERYRKMIDFERDFVDEKLDVQLLDITYSEEELYLEYAEKIGYLNPNYPYDSIAYLVDENDNEFSLQIRDNEIFVPFNLIHDKTNLRIKVVFKSKDSTKSAFLSYKKRESLEFDNCYIDFGRSVNNLLIMEVLPRNDFDVVIDNVDFADDLFVFTGKSENRIKSLYIQNLTSFERIKYPVRYDGDEFSVTIPYKNILNVPIKKWELNCGESPDSISISHKFNFYVGRNKIRISNQRHKILIENLLCNDLEELFIINNQIHDLAIENRLLKKSNSKIGSQNKKLSKSNNNLNNQIGEFKSRKAIRFVDTIKKI